MKALTLTQPWATLVAIGAKGIETRNWRTSFRGPLAIHAAKGWSRADRELCWLSPFAEALRAAPHPLLRGRVIAIAYLDDCRRITNLDGGPGLASLSDRERAFGDYTAGRWAWILTGVVALKEPVPARGALGLWVWEPPP